MCEYLRVEEGAFPHRLLEPTATAPEVVVSTAGTGLSHFDLTFGTLGLFFHHLKLLQILDSFVSSPHFVSQRNKVFPHLQKKIDGILFDLLNLICMIDQTLLRKF